jgi:hypothetical protein
MYCKAYVHSPMYKTERSAAGAAGASPAAFSQEGARRAAEAVDLEDSDMEALLLGLSGGPRETPHAGDAPPPASTEPGPYLVTAVVPFGAVDDEGGDVGHPAELASQRPEVAPDGKRGGIRALRDIEAVASCSASERVHSFSSSRGRSAASTLHGLGDSEEGSNSGLSEDEEGPPAYVPSPLAAASAKKARECQGIAGPDVAGPLPGAVSWRS